MTKKYLNGKLVTQKPGEVKRDQVEESEYKERQAKTGYINKRQMAYPAIGDQLDAIWDCLASIPALSEKGSKVYEQIQKIKKEFPKPAGGK